MTSKKGAYDFRIRKSHAGILKCVLYSRAIPGAGPALAREQFVGGKVVAASSPLKGNPVQSSDLLVRPSTAASGTVGDYLQYAFSLAHFIHPEREIAIRIVKEAR